MSLTKTLEESHLTMKLLSKFSCIPNLSTFKISNYTIIISDQIGCVIYLYRIIRDVMNNRLDVFRTISHATHVSWRVNRMKPNRILRQLFPKPAETPNWWSQSIERYIFIDESGSPPYPLVRK